MNVHELVVNYHHFSFFGLAGLLAMPWKGMVHTLSLFRKEYSTDDALVLKGQNADWIEPFDQPVMDWLDDFIDFSLTAGKSVEELQSLRKETAAAIRENEIALAGTITEIARTIGNRTLDSKTKAVTRNDLDARFNRLMRELEENEAALVEYNLAISKFFARRKSDNRMPEQSACV